MKKYFLTVLFIAFSVNILYSQIIIDKNDMPNINDTIRLSTTYSVNGIDYTQTGNDFLWDFSNLEPLIQKIDSFVDVSSTPIAYQYFFNNGIIYPQYKATIALKQPDIDTVQGFQLTDNYIFYKENDSYFSEVGMGGTLNGIPIPIVFTQPDILYHFPLTYNNTDSVTSSFSIDIPSLGYYENVKTHIDTVDGWGTLITPFGTFQTIRIKSHIHIHDSTYVDSIGMGIPTDIYQTEYKWLGKNYGEPLLQITKTGVLPPTVIFIDSVYTIGINENYNNLSSFNIYPNPCDKNLNIKYNLNKPADVKISLFSISGKKIFSTSKKHKNKGINKEKINLSNIKPGNYFLRLTMMDHAYTKKIIIK
ncbi:MAG: T9SS type A sorting domain-containing protein [Bacteroidales bacterium]|nr:T9SS type A sorting domain-containing protein [Bacteroidales bacterium]